MHPAAAPAAAGKVTTPTPYHLYWAPGTTAQAMEPAQLPPPAVPPPASTVWFSPLWLRHLARGCTGALVTRPQSTVGQVRSVGEGSAQELGEQRMHVGALRSEAEAWHDAVTHKDI